MDNVYIISDASSNPSKVRNYDAGAGVVICGGKGILHGAAAFNAKDTQTAEIIGCLLALAMAQTEGYITEQTQIVLVCDSSSAMHAISVRLGFALVGDTAKLSTASYGKISNGKYDMLFDIFFAQCTLSSVRRIMVHPKDTGSHTAKHLHTVAHHLATVGRVSRCEFISQKANQ